MQRVLELVFSPTPPGAGGVSANALMRRLDAHPQLLSAHCETAHIELELRHCEDPPSRDPAWRCMLLDAKARRFAVAVHDLAVLPGVRVRSWEPVPLSARQVPDFAGQCGAVRLRASFERHWWRVDLDGEAVTVSFDAGSMGGPGLPEGAGSLREFTELRLSLELADVDNPDDAGPDAGASADAEQRVALARQAVRLFDLALSLNEDGVFHLVEQDVLTQALMPDSHAEKAGTIAFGNGRTLVAVASAVMQNVFQQWLANAPGVAGTGGGEHVHQMRIALRRMRTAYRVLETALREAEIETDERELKWLGRLLGDLRDWDVLMEGTFPMIAGLALSSARGETVSEGVTGPMSGSTAGSDGERSSERSSERNDEGRGERGGGKHDEESDAKAGEMASAAAWERARVEVVKRREEVAESLRAALYSPRYALLVTQTARQIAVLAAAAGARHATPLNPFGRKLLRKRYRRLAGAKDLDKLPARERHRLRIHAKRLRYAVEFLAPAVDRKTRRRIAECMSALQDSLGAANDAVVARHFLSTLDLPPVVRAFANGYLSAREAFAVSGSAEHLEKIRKKKK
jgi:CHAD domain-containing protein